MKHGTASQRRISGLAAFLLIMANLMVAVTQAAGAGASSLQAFPPSPPSTGNEGQALPSMGMPRGGPAGSLAAPEPPVETGCRAGYMFILSAFESEDWPLATLQSDVVDLVDHVGSHTPADRTGLATHHGDGAFVVKSLDSSHAATGAAVMGLPSPGPMADLAYAIHVARLAFSASPTSETEHRIVLFTTGGYLFSWYGYDLAAEAEAASDDGIELHIVHMRYGHAGYEDPAVFDDAATLSPLVPASNYHPVSVPGDVPGALSAIHGDASHGTCLTACPDLPLGPGCDSVCGKLWDKLEDVLGAADPPPLLPPGVPVLCMPVDPCSLLPDLPVDEAGTGDLPVNIIRIEAHAKLDPSVCCILEPESTSLETGAPPGGPAVDTPCIHLTLSLCKEDGLLDFLVNALKGVIEGLLLFVEVVVYDCEGGSLGCVDDPACLLPPGCPDGAACPPPCGGIEGGAGRGSGDAVAFRIGEFEPLSDMIGTAGPTYVTADPGALLNPGGLHYGVDGLLCGFAPLPESCISASVLGVGAQAASDPPDTVFGVQGGAPDPSSGAGAGAKLGVSECEPGGIKTPTLPDLG